MEYRDSLDILLRDCRFVLNGDSIRKLLPGVEGFVPPLSSIRFADAEVPRFIWGIPVQHGKRLFIALNRLICEESLKCLSNPLYQENLRLLTPAELKEDPYFKVLSDTLLKALAENPALRLDSVLWIYLADVICRRLNQDEPLNKLFQEWAPDDAARFRHLDLELGKLRFKDPKRFADIRVRVLRSLFARNDFANSCMKEVFDEIPNNPLNREMIANRLIYTERPDYLHRTMDASDAFLVKGYKLTFTDFMAVHRTLRQVISGILQRGASGKLLPLDGWFLKTFVNDEVKQKAQSLPSQGQGYFERVASPQELAESEEREKVAFLLSLQEAPCSYLFFHLPDADKEYFRVIEKQGTIPKEVLKALRQRPAAIQIEPLYTEVARDLLRWDFFQALKARLRWSTRQGEKVLCEGRPLDGDTVVVNFDSFYEIYRRSRYGTAVFFDLVGFTDRTKALTRELKEAASRGDKERFSLSAVSLGIQRIFSIRNQLQLFGGIPQGFEGDAILDIFPRALDALRYVAAFSDNYHKNRLIRFRPFERPTENPYHDGFRVGLASGDYSLISIIGRSNELSAQKASERAVGHTINRASRLNSGKKGDAFLLGESEEDGQQDADDPFSLFRVRVSRKNELNNNGIASFEDTFKEIREQVKANAFPWYEPPTRQGGLVAGRIPRLRNYDFELIFEEPRTKGVFLVRRLGRRPELKGLEDEINTVYEYVMLDAAAFINLLEQDAQHVPVSRPVVNQPELSADAQRSRPGATSGDNGRRMVETPSSYDWQDTVDDDAVSLRSQHGIDLSELSRGREAISAAIERHDTVLKAHHPVSREARPANVHLPPWEIHSAELEIHGDSAESEPPSPAHSTPVSPASTPMRTPARPAAMPSFPPQGDLRELLLASEGAELGASDEDDAPFEPPQRLTSGPRAALVLPPQTFVPPTNASPTPTQWSSSLSPSSPSPFSLERDWQGDSFDLEEEQAVEAEESDELDALPEISLDWAEEVESHALLLELAVEVESEPKGQGAAGRRLVLPSGVRTGTGVPLRTVLADHVYTVLLPVRRGDPARVVIGVRRRTQLEDVHVYHSPATGREPWTLEPVFLQFLEELDLLDFKPTSTTWPLSEVLSAGLAPVPLDFLERLYMKLKVQGRL